MAETAGGNLTATAGRGHLRAAHADREQVVGALKVAFAQGQLARDEFDARVSQALVARTYDDLAAVVAGVPARPPAARPPRQSSRPRVSNAAKWGAAGLITPAILSAALAAESLPGDGGYAVLALVVACAYFVYWLSTGADMLWQWHCEALPTARTCVRCAHTEAAHRARASCAVRAGSVDVWRRCPCAGYVPPGRSPKTARLAV